MVITIYVDYKFINYILRIFSYKLKFTGLNYI